MVTSRGTHLRCMRHLFSLLRVRMPHFGRITSVTVVDLLFGLSIVICVILVAMSDL